MTIRFAIFLTRDSFPNWMRLSFPPERMHLPTQALRDLYHEICERAGRPCGVSEKSGGFHEHFMNKDGDFLNQPWWDVVIKIVINTNIIMITYDFRP